jgi:[acyl-carrier-protein] S-malonyltransferase
MTMQVFMFPGQSSADPAMLSRALRIHSAARAVADRARLALGDTLASRYLDGDRVPLDTNRDVQVALFLATQMHLAALQACGVDAEISLGLSLGEYSHLVHIGVLTLEDALILVSQRGALYEESAPGVMLAVLGATEDVVAEVARGALPRGRVVISNFNTPTQHVLAGDVSAVSWAAEQLEEEHGAHTMIIERRVPMHSPLMEDVAEKFRKCLDAAPWRAPARAYRPNVLGCAIDSPQPKDFVTHLAAHVSQPVRWRQAIEDLASQYPDATFIEVGPGDVLHTMLGKRWLAARRACTDVRVGIAPGDHFRATVEVLRACS